jgi:hypothetical protein
MPHTSEGGTRNTNVTVSGGLVLQHYTLYTIVKAFDMSGTDNNGRRLPKRNNV